MAADGHLNFDTSIDKSGFEEGKKELEKSASEASAEVKVDADTSQAQQQLGEVAQAAQEAAENVRSIPDTQVEISAETAPVTEAADQITDDLNSIENTAENASEKVAGSIRSAAKSAENRVDSTAEHIGESLNKLKGQLKSVAAAVGLAFGIREAVSFGKAAVENAASVNAANSQLSQTFGTLKNSATEAMKRVADESGIVRTRLQGVGTSVYAFARTSGMDSTQALGMMSEALQTAADSAAYYDRSLEDTSETLMSFLKGNYANDAALGLSATETTRNAAANKLYGKSFQELSEAQKQLTLLQMVKDANALSGAEGQAAREAEGWENVIGNLKEAWRQLLAVVGQPILKLAVTWVQQLTNALTYLTEKAQIAINTLAALFGKEAEDTGQAAENITQSVSAQEDLTDAVEDTAKAENRSLAGFDKINTVTSGSADNAGSSGSSGESVAIVPDITVKDNIPEVSERIISFVKRSKKLLGGLERYLKQNFAPSFKKVWKQLSPELDRFKENFRKIFGDIKTLGPPLLSYLNGDFTSFLRTFVETSGGILAGLLGSFNTVFSDIWNVAAYPSLQAFINDGLPMITQFCEEAALTYGTLFSEVKKGFDMIWEDAAKPSLALISKVWTDTMSVLKKFWDKWGGPIFSRFRTAIRKTGEVFRNVWETIFKPVFDTLMKVLDEVWTDHAKPLLEHFLDFAGQLALIALDIYNNFIAPLVNWFVSSFGPVISGVLSNIAEGAGEALGNAMDAADKFLSALEDLLNFVKNVFKGDWKLAWDSIKSAFSNVWGAMYSIAKTPLNAIIGLINKFIDGVETAINFLIDCLNKISFDTPDWLPFGAGGKHFGLDFDHVSLGEIPKLAQGTVVPANFGNFLAMLGDNKREPEVISPLSTIEKAVENAIAKMGGKDQTIHVHVNLDGREIGRVAVKAVRDDNARKGA